MNIVRKFREYATAFAICGSWCSLFVMALFSDRYVNSGRVLLFIAASVVIAGLSSSILLLLWFRHRITQVPIFALLVVSVSAVLLAAYMMQYNQSSVCNYYNVRAPILEKGIEKSKRKQYNHGAFCKIKTPVGVFDFQVTREVYAKYHIGDSLRVNIEIGKMQFIKIEQ